MGLEPLRLGHNLQDAKMRYCQPSSCGEIQIQDKERSCTETRLHSHDKNFKSIIILFCRWCNRRKECDDSEDQEVFFMPRCKKCGTQWKEPEGEEGEHPCPRGCYDDEKEEKDDTERDEE